MGTGHMGLQRIARAGRVPAELLQKYIYKWLSTAYDLFGKDSSSSAEWFYVWGLKGRYDEARQPAKPDKEHLNEFSRELYRQEVVEAPRVDQPLCPAGAPRLRAPTSSSTGRSGSSPDRAVLGDRRAFAAGGVREARGRGRCPNEEEKKFVLGLMREPGWLAPRGEVTARREPSGQDLTANR